MARYLTINGKKVRIGKISVPWSEVHLNNLTPTPVDNVALFSEYNAGAELSTMLSSLADNNDTQTWLNIAATQGRNIPVRVSGVYNKTAMIQFSGIEVGLGVVDFSTYRNPDEPEGSERSIQCAFYEDSLGVIRFAYAQTDYYQAWFVTDELWHYLETEEIDDGEEGDGPSGEGGGGGNYGKDSDIVNLDEFSDDPTSPNFVAGAAGSGLLHIYRPNLLQLSVFSRVLFTTDLFELLLKYWTDPMDFIVSFHCLPITPPAGDPEYIIYANKVLDGSFGGLPAAAAPKCPSQFMTVDMGTINVSEYWGSFLDYSPQTKVGIYLPYCGFQQLDTDDVMGGSIRLVYNIDILTGACVANIYVSRTQNGTELNAPLYTFTGSMSMTIPLSGTQGSDALLRFATMAADVASAGATGGVSGALTAGASVATEVLGTKLSYGRTGNLQGNTGILANQTPYMIFERPILSEAAGYKQLIGYPSNIREKLSSLHGLTVVERIIPNGIPATDSEISDIVKQLNDGVVLPSAGTTPPDEPDTTANIYLYTSTSSPNELVKTLTNKISLMNVKSTHSDDILHPTIEVSSSESLARVNYAYFPMFGRYYFVTGITYLNEGLWSLSMTVDVLMSYASEILEQEAIIDRQENRYNLYLLDKSAKALSQRRVQTVLFPKGFSRQPTYILAISGIST